MMELPRPPTAESKGEAPLRVGFILLKHFTLLPFAAFIDTLRLAADEDDQSRQIRCQWTIMGSTLDPVVSSSGVSVTPWELFRDPSEFDYLVIVGGLLHRGPVVSDVLIRYLQRADAARVPLVALCTASFALIRAGLMRGRRCCVSWFHVHEMADTFGDVIPVADQLFVDDGDRITCAGGAVAADLAAYVVERHLGQAWAKKSLRILVMDTPRPGRAPQPQPALDRTISHPVVKRALLLMEQHIGKPLTTEEIAVELSLSRRQFERLFQREMTTSPQHYYRQIRLRYGAWLLEKTVLPVSTIADSCGFADSAHFTRSFKTSYGKTPSQYRAHLSGSEDH